MLDLRRSMAGLSLLAVATLGTGAAVAAPADGYVITGLNLRAGPGTDYPVVVTMQAGDPVTIHGCLSGWSWCDIDWRDYRGWAAGDYLQVMYGQRRQPVVSYGAEVEVPFLSFSIGSYWGEHYRHRNFYGQMRRYRGEGVGPPPPPPPGFPPPPFGNRPPHMGPPPSGPHGGPPNAYQPPKPPHLGPPPNGPAHGFPSANPNQPPKPPFVGPPPKGPAHGFPSANGNQAPKPLHVGPPPKGPANGFPSANPNQAPKPLHVGPPKGPAHGFPSANPNQPPKGPPGIVCKPGQTLVDGVCR